MIDRPGSLNVPRYMGLKLNAIAGNVVVVGVWVVQVDRDKHAKALRDTRLVVRWLGCDGVLYARRNSV